MDLGRFFEKYKIKEGTNLKPSEAAELEIERWETYKKLITKRSRKYLKKDKKELQKYLLGNTFPLASVYESNSNRLIEMNPLFDVQTKTFPLWEKIKIAVDCIGIDIEDGKEIPTVKTVINEGLRDMINFLGSIDWTVEDQLIEAFDKKLEILRKNAITRAITKKILLINYPGPRDAYVD